MSTDIEKEVDKAISDLCKGSVEDHVEFFRRTARLFYNNEDNIKEIHRQRSTPDQVNRHAFARNTRNLCRSRSDFITGSIERSCSVNQQAEPVPVDDELDSVNGGYDIPDAGFVMPDCGFDTIDSNGYCDNEVPTTRHGIDDSNNEDDPIPFLRGASLQFFSEEDSEEDECDGLVCADGVGVDEVDAAYVSNQEPSRKLLENSEKEVMKGFEQKMKTFDVAIGDGVFIHTVQVCSNPDMSSNSASKIPLVMVHGIGGAIPAFYKNYEKLAFDRYVYGIDMPGFGLSERKVQFPNNPNACEQKMVDMIDRWREKMNIDKMILLGHSFGGYVSAAYVLQYHKHVHHLVLLDPWGVFSEEEDKHKNSGKWLERAAKTLCKNLRQDPFSIFSCFGTILGKAVLRLFMDAKVQKLYGQTCIDYLIRLNTTGEQMGAKAFTVISNYTFSYPEQPLKGRLINLLKNNKQDVHITFLYGEESLFYKSGHICAREVEKASPSQTVNIHCVKGAEHHIQVQKPGEMVDCILSSVYSPKFKGKLVDISSLCEADCLIDQSRTSLKLLPTNDLISVVLLYLIFTFIVFAFKRT